MTKNELVGIDISYLCHIVQERSYDILMMDIVSSRPFLDYFINISCDISPCHCLVPLYCCTQRLFLESFIIESGIIQKSRNFYRQDLIIPSNVLAFLLDFP